MEDRRSEQHFQGCLLGGAVGDALGAAVEFMDLDAIRRTFGSGGLTDYAPAYGRLGAITDDTQMTLFTAEAVIRAHNRALTRGMCSPVDVARWAYLRWLQTQGVKRVVNPTEPGWLIEQPGLFSRRAPGNTCLSALRGGARGTPDKPANNSKGCGGVMRMAPVGLVAPGMLDVFQTGRDFAALTHGHPSGYLAAGCFALLIQGLAQGLELAEAVESAAARLRGRDDGQEVLAALEAAVRLAAGGDGTAEKVEQLGAGWVAEEALAIGVYCALRADSFEHGVLLAVNHSGDSDSTGSIAGNILGLLMGLDAVPARWLEQLELREVISQVATDLWSHFGKGARAKWAELDESEFPPDWERYPGN
jgi:ADP-ribosylglycohydrolase